MAAASAALPLNLMAQQPQQTPQAFLEDIYRPYLQKDYKGQPYWEPARYFTPDLVAIMERDMDEADKRKEPPTLDGDPFVDAQDWEITALSISATADGGNATASVSFANFGQPKKLTISMMQTTAGWRIREISGYMGISSLREMYKLGK